MCSAKAGTVIAALASQLLRCFGTAVLLCLPVSALNPDRMLSQYAHTAWRIQDGVFSGAPQVLAQTTDGYIWVGTNLGLVRFDGVRFVSWEPPSGQRLPDPRIFSLVGARDGSLWIGTGYGVSHWQNGALSNYRQISGRIEAMLEDTSGSIWLARTQVTDGMGPVCRISNGVVQCFGSSDGIPFPFAMKLANAPSGELWIGGYSELCRWKPGVQGVLFRNTSPHPEGFASLKAIAAGADGSLWAAMESAGAALRLKHFTGGAWVNSELSEARFDTSDTTAMFVDANNALWIGTAHHGVFRAQRGGVEHFGRADGLSSDAIDQFAQDREGNLWVVTSEGMDNFRDLRVVSYAMREGLSSGNADTVLASRDGTVWIGDFHALDSMRDGKLSAIRTGHGLPGRYITTMFEDHAGRLWVGIDSGLWVYDKRHFRTIRRRDGRPLGIVFAITEDSHQDIWVRAGPNLDRIHDFALESETSSPQIAAAYTLAANPRDGLILGMVNGDLLLIGEDGTQRAVADEAEGRRQIRDLLVEGDGSAWATTLDELVRWKEGTRRSLTTHNGLPCDGIFALTEGDAGSLWLDTRCGLIGITRPELEHWWTQPDSLIRYQQIDELDGLQPGLTSLKPQITRAPDGRLWMVDGRILQMLDLSQLDVEHVPAPVHINEIFADRQAHSANDHLRLPPLTRTIELDYTAPSFLSPRRVHFRYRLDGYDRDWVDAGTRRQAFYSDLRPGNYTFRVIASKYDRVWDQHGAAVGFSIAPALYQTIWFRSLLWISVAVLVGCGYLLRIRQLTERVQSKLGARIEERERIARELHDTLLQGFQGLTLRFQAVLKRMPADETSRSMMESLLDRADQVLLEGRERVRDLRQEALTGDELPEAFARFGQELTRDDAVEFAFAVVGRPRSLDATVRSEAYRIGGEALTNAFQHAHASRIEAEITYSKACMHLRIRDDGSGIDPNILRAGRRGHWGISGMRERAHAIGGKLSIWSRTGAGTEVDLMIPGRIAYARNREVLR